MAPTVASAALKEGSGLSRRTESRRPSYRRLKHDAIGRGLALALLGLQKRRPATPIVAGVAGRAGPIYGQFPWPQPGGW